MGWQAAVLGLALIVGGCAYPTRNSPLELPGTGGGHRYSAYLDAGARHGNKRLVILTMSGGGTRAAALALGVLRGLKEVAIVGTGRSLADEVDIVSSVSGGSVTAAYFALFGGPAFQERGKPYLDRLDRDFIRRDIIAEILSTGLNPVTLARLSTPAYERIDLLREKLDERLFGGRDFRALDDGQDRPFLVLNAADMAAGTVFPFTQDQFDLLCSRLETVKIADAVAASGAFPVALSPLTLKNNAPCLQLWDKSTYNPRISAINALRSFYLDPYSDLVRSRRAWEDWTYLNLELPEGYGSIDAGDPRWMVAKHDRRKDYVHLLDGGIADNLGLSEPLVMLVEPERLESLPERLVDEDITSIVFIVVNARSESDSKLDQSQATPGMLDMLLATTDSTIDAAMTATLDSLPGIVGDLTKALELDNLAVTVVPIDFDYVADPACRSELKNIQTSWTLTREQIDLLEGVGQALLYDALRQPRSRLGFGIALPAPALTVAQACHAG